MNRPFWEGHQFSTESSSPGVSSNSWNFSNILSSLDNDCSSVSSYPTDASTHSLQATISDPTMMSNNCAPCSSSSQSSTSSGRTIFSILKDKSYAELQMILRDKDIYKKLLHSIGEVKYLESFRDDLSMKTIQMARRNLEFSGRIGELRNQCTIIRTTELAVAEEKFQELEISKKETERLLPRSLLQNLKDAAKECDEQSEQLQNLFLAGEIDLIQFIPQYKRLRKIYHWRLLIHLAAMSSVSST